MPRTLALTRSLLATHRPGRLVAVALGQSVQFPRRRARGYQLRALDTGLPSNSVAVLPAQRAVALVEVRGVLEQRASEWACGESAGYDEVTERLLGACADAAVAAVVLSIDSPGGDVAGLAEACKRVRAAYTSAAKPLLAYCDEMAASAAYYLAATCDGIYAPASGLVGSIGAYIAHASEARALDAEGIDVTIVRSPEGKANPSDVEALDDLGRARLAAIVERGANDFAAYISARRGMSTSTIRALNAAVLPAPDALTAGLIDGLGSLEEAIALAGALAGLEAA